ncbi:hypothetical protein NHP21005_09030 [Helicobacter sp. NHP21005]|uniref:hypothetical protein n=1 Tax=Helicobacter felistomachi TaxID=3040201 RepID=UPI002572A742|nr:hypothetical protein [Helicobacter sp. NHP21005]BEG57215.1 hypothetical protein NHP21005_09030 [Helicobacter sp. NHP21005]
MSKVEFKPPIREVKIKNFLSFGENGLSIELKNLHVLSGYTKMEIIELKKPKSLWSLLKF